MSETDFVAQAGVNISRSVLITGVTNTSADDEIVNELRAYGSLKTVLPVSDPKSTFYKNLIVEFKEADAYTDFEQLLPYQYTSLSAANRVFCVTALANEYAATVGSSNPTPNYLTSFKEMAQKSGVSLEDVLKAVMNQIREHLDVSGATEDEDQTNTNGEEKGEESKVDIWTAPPVPEPHMSLSASRTAKQPSSLSWIGHQGARSHQNPPTEPMGAGSAPRVPLTPNDLNPPEIQRVVVEHVVRNVGLSVPPSLQLRTFSGRIPKPNAEADYESWRSQIDLLLADPNLSALHVTRRIMESLLTPAAELIKGLGPDTLPTILLRVLDSAFGTVQDGEELYAQYLNILQNPGEKPSVYLQRLQLTLNTVVRRGGISAAETDRHLLKQFVRGCWDNAVITKLQLEQRRDNPPPFSELLLLLRTEEDRQQVKETLMKKHIGSSSSKPRVNIQSQSACSCGHSSATSNELKELKKQMQDLQRQMTAFLSVQQRAAQSKPAPRQSSRPSPSSAAKPRPWYCFNCGEDGHISSSCSNPANPTLVEQKKKELRKKQQAWNTKNTQTGQSN